MAPNALPLLKEARNRLARAERCFEQVYQSQPEFSLAAERVRELLQETKSWLEDYSEEVRDERGTAGEDRPIQFDGLVATGGTHPVVQSEQSVPAEVGTGDVAVEWVEDSLLALDEVAGQSETDSTEALDEN